MPIATSWLRSLAARIDTTASFDAAKEIVETWAEDVRNDDRFAGLIARTGLVSDLAGRLMIHGVELHEEHDLAVATAARAMIATRAGDDDGAFLSLPYNDAIDFFASKQLMTIDELHALDDRFKTAGFAATGLAGDELLDRAHSLIQDAIEGHLTLDELVAGLRLAADGDSTAGDAFGMGIAPTSTAYLETVARTNIQVAYGAGRYEAMSSPAVLELRPYWQYLTARDSRVRRAHRLLDGRVFEGGSTLGQWYYPPCGYNCRCNMVTLSARQYDERGLELTLSHVDGADPDEGFTGAPAPLS